MCFVDDNFSAVRYGRVPKRSREQLESESKTLSVADSMGATALQVTTTTVTTTTVVANAATAMEAAIGLGSAPAVTTDPMIGNGTAAVIEANGGSVSVSYDVIAAISQAHLTNCDYTDELTRTLLRKPVASPVNTHCRVEIHFANLHLIVVVNIIQAGLIHGDGGSLAFKKRWAQPYLQTVRSGHDMGR